MGTNNATATPNGSASYLPFITKGSSANTSPGITPTPNAAGATAVPWENGGTAPTPVVNNLTPQQLAMKPATDFMAFQITQNIETGNPQQTFEMLKGLTTPGALPPGVTPQQTWATKVS